LLPLKVRAGGKNNYDCVLKALLNIRHVPVRAINVRQLPSDVDRGGGGNIRAVGGVAAVRVPKNDEDLHSKV